MHNIYLETPCLTRLPVYPVPKARAIISRFPIAIGTTSSSCPMGTYPSLALQSCPRQVIPSYLGALAFDIGHRRCKRRLAGLGVVILRTAREDFFTIGIDRISKAVILRTAGGGPGLSDYAQQGVVILRIAGGRLPVD
ncbi:MAG: hypothetical protein R2828_21535 [Saprospiraceae bacterium]